MTDPKRYDPFEKTAPTVSLEIVLCQLNIAASKKLSVESFDVPGAYLNAELKPGRYHKMRINKGIARLLVEADPTSKEYLCDDGTILVEIRRSNVWIT